MIFRTDQHLEQYLGPIDRGWRPSGEPQGVQVCLFKDQPNRNEVCYATLGLSDHILTMPGGRGVRQELVFAAHARQASDEFSNLLMHIAEMMLKHHRAWLRGEVVRLGYPISPGGSCSDLYVSIPVIFPEGFEVYRGSNPPTIFAWLFPITPAEVQQIDNYGWGRFEDTLEQCERDLLDVTRY